MKLFKTKPFLFAALITIIFSCKKETIAPYSPSFNYFPTENGRFIVYDVDSVLHADNDNHNDDSVYRWHFQIKEVIESDFVDGQGRTAQIIRRYKRDNDSAEWNFYNTWTQVLTSFSAYKTEDNIPYHKLSFPINSQVTWNGNDANMQEEELYSYDDYNTSLSMNNLSFDSTLTVLQRDDNNFVQKIFAKEVYANNVGMIYKERDDLSKLNGMVVSGTEYKMKVKSYGKE